MKRQSNERPAGAVTSQAGRAPRAWVTAALALLWGWTAFASAAPGGERLLTLEDALTRAAQHHPIVWEAEADARQAQLEFERSHEVGRRLQASVRTEVGRLAWRSDDEDGFEFTSGLTLDRPVTLTANWQLAPGTTLSGRVSSEKDDNRVATLSLTRQLWPHPMHSSSEISRQAALEGLDELPKRQERAQASAFIDVYKRYRGLQVDEARVELLAQAVEAKEEHHALMSGRREWGLASEEEVIEAALDLDRARADLERAERNLSLTKEAFARDLGLASGDFHVEPLPDEMAVVEVDLAVEEAIQEALAASAEVRAAERHLRSVERRVEAARQAGPFTVSIGVETNLSTWSDRPHAAAFVTGSYDLLDGGARRVERQEAELALERARRDLDSARKGVQDDVARRLSELEWLRRQVEFAEVSLSLAERTYQARLEQARMGLATRAAVDESRRAAEEARLESIDAVVAYEAARLELWSLLGRELEIQGFLGYPSP